LPILNGINSNAKTKKVIDETSRKFFLETVDVNAKKIKRQNNCGKFQSRYIG
jgi:hypothetical protein